MAEPVSPTDEVNDYLLGRLTPAARRKFEARLEQDAELRREVRALEEGVLALAMSAPRREPPRTAWLLVEAAVARSARWNGGLPFWKMKWLANGWAMAGCLAAAFFIHAFWFRPAAPPLPPLSSVAANTVETKINPVAGAEQKIIFTSVDEAGQVPKFFPGVKTNLPAAARVAQMQLPSQTAVGPKQGLELVSLAASARSGRTRLSREMRQAILLAVARQLGWSRSGEVAADERPVDFVDLPNSDQTDTLPTFAAADPAGLADVISPANFAPLVDAGLPADLIPILAWDGNVFAAIDPSTLPAGSRTLSVWSVDGGGNTNFLGAVALGGNPTILNINNADTTGGMHYYLTVGGTNIIGQYPPP